MVISKVLEAEVLEQLDKQPVEAQTDQEVMAALDHQQVLQDLLKLTLEAAEAEAIKVHLEDQVDLVAEEMEQTHNLEQDKQEAMEMAEAAEEPVISLEEMHLEEMVALEE